MNSDFKFLSVSHTKLSLLQKTLYIVHKPYVDCLIDRYDTFMRPFLKKHKLHNVYFHKKKISIHFYVPLPGQN